MALIVSVPLQGDYVAAGCYVRISVVDVVKKNRRDGTFYACADLAVYKNAVEAARVSNGELIGKTLVSPGGSRQGDRSKYRCQHPSAAICQAQDRPDRSFNYLGRGIMNPEEIQEQMAVLEQRLNQRVQLLSANDPQAQRLIGQMEGLKVQGAADLDNSNNGKPTVDADSDRLTLIRDE